MSKHTPGPWTFVPDDREDGILGVVWGEGWPIAEIYSDILDPEEAEADTRLIAAAPELLAALQGLYADQVDYLTLNNLGGMDNHWMKAARAAIAKATGEA